MKVLVSDGLSEKGLDILKKTGFDIDVIKYSPKDLVKEIAKYNAIIIRSGTRMTAEIIEAADNLKVIGRAGSGLDNVDLDAATKKGIVVMNTPGGNTVTTAEHAISMLVSMARKVPQATMSMKAGKWEKKKFMGVELYNKVLGVVGVGQIGSHVARVARGMYMKVVGFDPFLSPEKAKQLDIELVTIDELYAQADFISLHTPSTKDTADLVCKESINKMKDGVHIINCSRGQILNEKDLLNALESGKVASAALDVFKEEPVPAGYGLINHPNVICTPHLGAQTMEAQVNVAVAVAGQVADMLEKNIIRNAVNLPSVSTESMHEVQPYMVLAEKLGSFQSQIYEGGLESITIEYHGHVAGVETDSVTIAAIKGLLSPILKETVNYVNAKSIAKERGIVISEVKYDDSGDFTDLIRLKIESGSKVRTISGALFLKKQPRIIEIDSFAVEIELEGCMLVVFGNDKPGMIGSIGSSLGEHHVNIAKMQFGRETPGGRSVAVVNIDDKLNNNIILSLAELDNIVNVKQVIL